MSALSSAPTPAPTVLGSPVQNLNPLLVDACVNDDLPPLEDAELDALRDEVYSLIRHIHDPEHPHSLEQLGVVYKSGLSVRREYPPQPSIDSAAAAAGVVTPRELVDVEFKPTVPHCSLATLIGLCIRTKVKQSIPHIKFAIHIKPGSHSTADQSQADSSSQLGSRSAC